jgi:hypothetical protein
MEFKILTRPSQPELEAVVASYLESGWEALGGIAIRAKGPNRDAEYSQVLVRRAEPTAL